MLSPLSYTARLTYKHIYKPLLFKFNPDDVHSSILKFGSRIQRFRAVNHLIHTSLAYKNETTLGQKVGGITFHNPVGLAAGFDKNFELAHMLKSIGFGFMEGGSLTYHKCEGNPRPWFHRLPKSQSIVVYAGLANNGVKAIIETLRAYPNDTFHNFPLNISIAKTNSKKTCTDNEAVADYVGSLRLLQKAQLGDIYTLNISCPNIYGGEPFTTPERLELLLDAIDQLKVKQPVFIKMPSHLKWEYFGELLDVADKHNVMGVTIGNLAKDRAQANLMDPLPDAIKGNLSGKPTWELSNNLIRQTYKNYGKRFVIIGVGGIFCAEDAYTKIKMGATLVELISGLIFEGPQLIGQINKDLVSLLEKDGYNSITEAIGAEA